MHKKGHRGSLSSSAHRRQKSRGIINSTARKMFLIHAPGILSIRSSYTVLFYRCPDVRRFTSENPANIRTSIPQSGITALYCEYGRICDYSRFSSSSASQSPLSNCSVSLAACSTSAPSPASRHNVCSPSFSSISPISIPLIHSKPSTLFR